MSEWTRTRTQTLGYAQPSGGSAGRRDGLLLRGAILCLGALGCDPGGTQVFDLLAEDGASVILTFEDPEGRALITDLEAADFVTSVDARRSTATAFSTPHTADGLGLPTGKVHFEPQRNILCENKPRVLADALARVGPGTGWSARSGMIGRPAAEWAEEVPTWAREFALPPLDSEYCLSKGLVPGRLSPEDIYGCVAAPRVDPILPALPEPPTAQTTCDAACRDRLQTACPLGQARFLDGEACVDIKSCPSGEWPANAPAAAVYVRQGALAGDGTAALPYATIEEAVIAGGNAPIVLAAGSYRLGLRNLRRDIIGVCPARVSLDRPVTISDARLEGVTVGRVVATGDVSIQRCMIDSEDEAASAVFADGRLLIESSRINRIALPDSDGERGLQTIAIADGGELTMRRVIIRSDANRIVTIDGRLEMDGVAMYGAPRDPTSHAITARTAIIENVVLENLRAAGFALGQLENFEDKICDLGTYTSTIRQTLIFGSSSPDNTAIIQRCGQYLIEQTRIEADFVGARLIHADGIVRDVEVAGVGMGTAYGLHVDGERDIGDFESDTTEIERVLIEHVHSGIWTRGRVRVGLSDVEVGDGTWRGIEISADLLTAKRLYVHDVVDRAIQYNRTWADPIVEDVPMVTDITVERSAGEGLWWEIDAGRVGRVDRVRMSQVREGIRASAGGIFTNVTIEDASRAGLAFGGSTHIDAPLGFDQVVVRRSRAGTRFETAAAVVAGAIEVEDAIVAIESMCGCIDPELTDEFVLIDAGTITTANITCDNVVNCADRVNDCAPLP